MIAHYTTKLDKLSYKVGKLICIAQVRENTFPCSLLQRKDAIIPQCQTQLCDF